MITARAQSMCDITSLASEASMLTYHAICTTAQNLVPILQLGVSVTTDETPRPDTSAEAGEVESNTEDQIPGQESLFPGLHGDGDGGQHLISPLSGKPLIPPGMSGPPLMTLEKEPGEREYLVTKEEWGEPIGNGLMRRPSPHRPKRLFGDDEPGVARGTVPLASMREPGFLDQPERIEKINPIETPVYDQPLADAVTIKTAVSDKARLLADPEREDNERVNLSQNGDGSHFEQDDAPSQGFLPDESNFFRILKADEPTRGDETGMPVVGFTFTALMPDGSIIEGGLQAPCAHENYTPHGRLKNADLLAEIAALSLQQFLDELAKRKALAEAAYRAQNAYCGK